MTYRGTIRNGVVVVEGGTDLPDGTVVRIEPVRTPAAEPRQTGALSPLFGMGRRAARTGLPDLATNLDHYLYG